MQIHRLLTKEYAEYHLRGSFRFGRLRYYQMLEIVFEDQSIGDAQEGTISTVFDAKLTPENKGEPIWENLAKSGIVLSGENPSIHIRNTTITSEIDCFVCCWSTSASPDLSGTGSTYDTRVIAAGAKSLAYYLNTSGVERESGSKVLELFYPILSRRVQYSDSVPDLAAGPMPRGDPFRKRLRYAKQAEYRLVLIPRETISADFVHIECRQAAELLRSAPVERAETVTQKSATKRLGAEYYQQLLSSILAAWKQFDQEFAINGDLGFRVPQSTGRGIIDVQAWREKQEEAYARRTAALAEFDKAHLKNLQRCLFELRTPPLNEALDRALASGKSSDWLIRHYERQQRQLHGWR